MATPPYPRTSIPGKPTSTNSDCWKKVRTRYSRKSSPPLHPTSRRQSRSFPSSTTSASGFARASASIPGRRRDGIRSAPTRSWGRESSRWPTPPSTRASGQSLCARRTAHPLLRRGSAGHRGGSQPRQPLRHRPGTTRAAVRARHRHARHFARLVMARIHTLRSTNFIDEPTGLYNRLRLQEDVSLRLQRDGALTVIAADLLPLALLNTIIRTLGYPFPTTSCSRRATASARTAGFHPLQDQPDALRTAPATAATGRNRVGLPPLAAGLRKPVVCRGIPIKAIVGLGVLPLADDPSTATRTAAPGGQRGRRRPRPRCRLGPLQPAAGPGPAARLHIADLAVPAIGTEGLPSGVSAENRPADRQVHGVEALLRWRHPQLGFVSPAEFVPLAENRTDAPLSDWVLRHAMAQLAQWNARNIPLRLAINVSASDMEDSSFLEEAVRLAKTYDIDLSALELEFTESVLIRDASAVGSVLLRARELGMASPWTTSAPAAATGPTCATCRSPPSSSINHSPATSPARRRRRRHPGGDRPGQPVGLSGGRGRHRDPRHLPPAAGLGLPRGPGLSDRPADAAGATGGLAAALADAGTWNGPYQHARQPRRVDRGLVSKAQTR